jgi:hypothetical protein
MAENEETSSSPFRGFLIGIYIFYENRSSKTLINIAPLSVLPINVDDHLIDLTPNLFLSGRGPKHHIFFVWSYLSPCG